MDFRKYSRGIKFEVKPSEKTHMLEVYNTQVPETISDEFTELCAIPRMSTFAIGALINKAVHDMPNGQCYLNIGVWHGFSLLAGMLGNPDKKCIGVDNFSEFGGPRLEFRKRFLEAKSENHEFFEMGYQQYFAGFHKGLIGFYFYDGSHDYKSQLNGLQIAEPFLADDALIMVDDTNWPDPEKATLDFMEQSKFNYEIILNEKTCQNMHPTWWNGIMIIQKKGLKQNAY